MYRCMWECIRKVEFMVSSMPQSELKILTTTAVSQLRFWYIPSTKTIWITRSSQCTHAHACWYCLTSVTLIIMFLFNYSAAIACIDACENAFESCIHGLIYAAIRTTNTQSYRGGWELHIFQINVCITAYLTHMHFKCSLDHCYYVHKGAITLITYKEYGDISL